MFLTARVLVAAAAVCSEVFADVERSAAAGDLDGDEVCALQVKKGKTQTVNCGGHTAPNCQACTEGPGYYYGEAYCNGDCHWQGSNHYEGQCVATGQACCRANTLDCVSCAAGMTPTQYCQAFPHDRLCALGPSPSPSPALPAQVCALCETCGNQYPIQSGRITYFRDFTSHYISYGEACSAQLRERTSETLAGGVIYSPKLCCTSSRGAFIETGARSEVVKEEVQKLTEVSAVQEEVKLETQEEVASNSSADGWCRLCDQCGGGFDERVGEITELKERHSGWDSNSENYERYVDRCSSISGSKGAPPAAKVCCKRSANRGVCAVCQGRCGGSYPNDGGALTWTSERELVKYTGLGYQCGSSLTQRLASDMSDAPRLCCMNR